MASMQIINLETLSVSKGDGWEYKLFSGGAEEELEDRINEEIESGKKLVAVGGVFLKKQGPSDTFYQAFWVRAARPVYLDQE